MIYTHIAFAQNECKNNIGCAYNKIMETIDDDDDWVCFLDHDAMFTTNSWLTQIQQIINMYPDIGAFGARTNRVGYSWQLVGNIDIDNHDIDYHRKIGKHIQSKYYEQISVGSTFEIPNSESSEFSGHLINEPRFSGTLILVKKKSWSKIGGFKEKGFLEVDDDFRKRLSDKKIKFGIMDGVYVYHWYRADDPYKTSSRMLNKVRENFKKSVNYKNFDLNNIILLK